MATAELVLDKAFCLAPVPTRLFGSFVEHMGRCVYTGIYQPDHPTADEAGLRGDVLELTREVGPSVVRYPGGNFVSGYRWEDGVGPRAERPHRPDPAWHAIETNAVGVHEFDDWARKAGTEVMMAVNLGTRGVQEACDLLEYTNLPTGTHWADRRRAHGAREPFGYRLWSLGNEMDGPWQIGHTTAEAYGRAAAATARAMRMLDPGIELVACGSSGRDMATFGAWETTVLEHCYDDVDYISLHAYYAERDGDADSYLASAMGMDAYIDDVVAVVDAVRARGRHGKQVDLSFDEWNAARPAGGEGGTRPWQEHPPIAESDYTITDAIAVGTYLNALLRHGDRVTIACQAQLVNVLGLIRTEEDGPAWLQTIAYPFAQMRRLARGAILRVGGVIDRYDTADFTDVPVVDVGATFDEGTGRAALFLAHRGRTEPAQVGVDVRGLGVTRVSEAMVLHPGEGQNRLTGNTPAHDAVRPRPFTDHRLADGRLEAVVPPLSWTVLELAGPRT